MILENIWELYLELGQYLRMILGAWTIFEYNIWRLEFVWEPWNSDLDLYYSRQQQQQRSSDVIVIIVVMIIVIIIIMIIRDDEVGILWQSETSSSERNLTWALARPRSIMWRHKTSTFLTIKNLKKKLVFLLSCYSFLPVIHLFSYFVLFCYWYTTSFWIMFLLIFSFYIAIIFL